MLFPGIDLKKGSFTNYCVTEKSDRKHEICAMNWTGEDENQVFDVLSSNIILSQKYKLCLEPLSIERMPLMVCGHFSGKATKHKLSHKLIQYNLQ